MASTSEIFKHWWMVNRNETIASSILPAQPPEKFWVESAKIRLKWFLRNMRELIFPNKLPVNIFKNCGMFLPEVLPQFLAGEKVNDFAKTSFGFEMNAKYSSREKSWRDDFFYIAVRIFESSKVIADIHMPCIHVNAVQSPCSEIEKS